jgi:hypothetical protein
MKDQHKGRYIALPHTIIGSESYHNLSGSASKALIALISQFNGRNNGAFTASWSLMSKRGFRSTDTLARALKALLTAKLIVKTQNANGGSCALYAVTWLPINECLGALQNPVRKKVALKELLLRHAK